MTELMRHNTASKYSPENKDPLSKKKCISKEHALQERRVLLKTSSTDEMPRKGPVSNCFKNVSLQFKNINYKKIAVLAHRWEKTLISFVAALYLY